MLHKIDQAILDFWFTYPNERGWAYLATLPLLVLVIDALVHFI